MLGSMKVLWRPKSDMSLCCARGGSAKLACVSMTCSTMSNCFRTLRDVVSERSRVKVSKICPPEVSTRQ